MFNSKPNDDREHACGWRRVGTFWPSAMTGDVDGIGKWQKKFENMLDTLEAERIKDSNKN